MGKENMDFGPAHHGGIPSEAELRWRKEVVRIEYEKRYYPHGRDNQDRINIIQSIRPQLGGTPDVNYMTRMARQQRAWHTRME